MLTKNDLLAKVDALSFGPDCFAGKYEKVKYFSGLPTEKHLKTIFAFVSDGVECSQANSLPSFQQFSLTLMKLRLNIGDQLLAYQFDISQSTVSHHIATWIDVLLIKLHYFLPWPSWDVMCKTMPMDF